MKLWAISDLHLGSEKNLREFSELSPHGDDWLIIAGDVGETDEHLRYAIKIARSRFGQVIWVPGNHELWTVTRDGLRGDLKYWHLVDLCRQQGVMTPEDPFPRWDGEGQPHLIVPMHLLYDYSFGPSGLTPVEAVAWAAESGVCCADEELLHSEPYASRAEWCRIRCEMTEMRLFHEAKPAALPLVLVNHFPLKSVLANLPRVPRFKIWCGTTRTEEWHICYGASVVISGHLHIPQSTVVDGVRFEEVSFGYSHQRRQQRHVDSYLRQILPVPDLRQPPG